MRNSKNLIELLKEQFAVKEPLLIKQRNQYLKRTPEYKSKDEAYISIFFEEVLWESLLVNHWQLFSTWEDARDTVVKLEGNVPAIKKAWLANPSFSLLSVLTTLGLLSTNQLAKSKRRLLSSDHTWLFDNAEDLLAVLKLPQERRAITKCDINKIGVKKKNLCYKCIEDITPIQMGYLLGVYTKPPTNTLSAIIKLFNQD